MWYENILLSLGIAVLVLGVNLMVQSRLAVISPTGVAIFGQRIKRIGYVGLILGILLVMVGVLLGVFIISSSDVFVKWVSLGCTILILAGSLMAQGRRLSSRGFQMKTLGNKLWIWAWICAGSGAVILSIIVSMSLCIAL